MTTKCVRTSPALLLAVLFVACGYNTTTRTAKDIKSIHVPFFNNQTSEPNLEITVTESVILYLIEDNTLRVADESDADAVLDGSIVEFQNRPFSFNLDLNAEEYRVVVRVRVTLYNRRTNEPIWSDRVLVGDGSYFIDKPDANTFNDAVAESIREITERILNLTVQDW
ncbi:MAG: LPS assembly lipoprotein LptE [Candidatus Krumholzibacteria bacterium]|nr:LPS assembly lipoprotein LptE [Candidatus Krumholzibacteria bacterium]